MKTLKFCSEFKTLSMRIKQVKYNGVIYKRHKNPDGTLGGWVGENALVFGNARVSDNARVFGNARVFDNARVSDHARVYGNTWVSGNARVFGNTTCFVKTINLFGYTISVGDDSIFVGCKSYSFKEVKKLTYKDVKKEVSLTNKEFKQVKEIVLKIIDFRR